MVEIHLARDGAFSTVGFMQINAQGSLLKKRFKNFGFTRLSNET